MSKTDTGGPACPVHGGGGDDPRNKVLEGGLTLLDYFAAEAMQALITNPVASQSITVLDQRSHDDDFARAIAANAYGFAEAMVAEKRRRESAP